MDRTLDDLRAVVAHAEICAPSVSQWNVGMHVHHCALSMINIGKGLAKSTALAPPAKPSIAKTVVFTLGRIPRGRAKTSATLTPQLTVPPAELLSLLDESAKELDAAKRLGPDTWITHPVFGPLRRDDALEFVRIHNRHHLKIVSDILKRQA
jgi:Protein of unknown function (DUF1569)